MSQSLSRRAAELIPALDEPWRWAPRGTYSHDDKPDGLVAFATAENSLVHEELEAFTRHHFSLPQSVFSYKYSTAGGTRLPRLLAQHLNEYFKPSRPLNGNEIRITGSATAMHELLGWAVGDPGDAILTSKPVYGRFELDFGVKAGLKMVYAETTHENSFDARVIDAFEAALAKSRVNGVSIRAVLIVNPNNPIGRCYPKETIVGIMKFCQRHRLHLISDEIYATSVFSDHDGLPAFTSVLSIEPGIIEHELLHVTYGFSKDFGAAGLRLGCVVTRSAPVMKLIQMTMRFHNPSGVSVAIANAILENRDWCRQFISDTRRKISDAYNFATKGLRELGVQYLPANAGFFVYINLSPFLKEGVEDAEFDLSQRLFDGGVFFHPKEEHGEVGWYRMVYTQDRQTVAEGLRRMELVLGKNLAKNFGKKRMKADLKQPARVKA